PTQRERYPQKPVWIRSRVGNAPLSLTRTAPCPELPEPGRQQGPGRKRPGPAGGARPHPESATSGRKTDPDGQKLSMDPNASGEQPRKATNRSGKQPLPARAADRGTEGGPDRRTPGGQCRR